MTVGADIRVDHRPLYDRIAGRANSRAGFEAMLRQDRRGDLEPYCWNAARFFGGVDLTGKHILEIGSGRGLTSVFMGLQGAARVVSMEPGLAGSRPGVLSAQQERVEALGLQQVVTLIDADFNTWDPAGDRFDVVISQASINHLYESPHHALHHRDTFERYQQIWQRMRSLLLPGGVCCVSDACRYGLFAMTKRAGLRRPWNTKQTSINWRIHQNPGTWRRIALAAGFSAVEIEYPLPYSVRHLGPLVANPVSNFFLRAAFSIRASA
jgi:SAM-dependent methyltransferase